MLRRGQVAKVVLATTEGTVCGALLVLPTTNAEKVCIVPVVERCGDLNPDQAIDILAAQERVFGKRGLAPLELA